MDILRKNLDLAVINLEDLLAKSSGKMDGRIIDALRIVESCRDIAYDTKSGRRWIDSEVRLPDESDVYETVIGSGKKRFVTYNEYNASTQEWEHSGVTSWRKRPKLPKE